MTEKHAKPRGVTCQRQRRFTSCMLCCTPFEWKNMCRIKLGVITARSVPTYFTCGGQTKKWGGPVTIPEPFPPVVARATPCVHSQRLLLSQLVAVTSLSCAPLFPRELLGVFPQQKHGCQCPIPFCCRVAFLQSINSVFVFFRRPVGGCPTHLTNSD